MRDYAQIIKEAAYTGYDRYTLDFQDDRYMSRLQGEELKHKICELRDSAEKIVLDWLIDMFEEQGYSLESCNNYEGTVSCDMRSEDNNRVEISLHKREKNKFGHADVEVDEWKNQKHECTKFQIKVSTENSRGRHIFRMPQEPYPRTLFPELGKEEECEEWWVRVVCDPKSGEAVELNVYTDPC